MCLARFRLQHHLHLAVAEWATHAYLLRHSPSPGRHLLRSAAQAACRYLVSCVPYSSTGFLCSSPVRLLACTGHCHSARARHRRVLLTAAAVRYSQLLLMRGGGLHMDTAMDSTRMGGVPWVACDGRVCIYGTHIF